MIQNKPNFFIIGAPKCGTTAMAEYLKRHNNIFMSSPKEPHFFSTDLPGYNLVNNINEYLDLFKNIKPEHNIIGEASVYYLYSKEAILNIYKFNKNAKILVMLRNPIEMVYSLHSQLIQSGNETELDFQKAWALAETRKKGMNLPKYSKNHKVLFYNEISKYHEQIDNVYNYFPKDQVHIVLFDDFKKDTKKCFDEVLAFLNVKNDYNFNFEKINENASPRNNFINTLVKKQPYGIKLLKNKIKNILGIKQFGLAKKLSKLNTKKTIRQKLDNNLRKEIYEVYKYDIEKLSIELNRNLKHWN